MSEKKSTYTGQTDARRKASAKYLKESVEDIRIRVPKGDKVKVQEHAASMGESTNAFVVRAITETMSRDNQITEASQKDITSADHTQRNMNHSTASSNAFEEKREQMLRQYEALTSTAGSQRKKPEPDPFTPPHETLDAKMERLRKEHLTQAPASSNE